jgi:hypothetical protein
MYERCATWRRGEINKEVDDHVHNDDTILAADLIRKCLSLDPAARPLPRTLLESHEFLRDFVGAWNKVMHLDRFDLKV